MKLGDLVPFCRHILFHNSRGRTASHHTHFTCAQMAELIDHRFGHPCRDESFFLLADDEY